jgi:hypothetical protein
MPLTPLTEKDLETEGWQVLYPRLETLIRERLGRLDPGCTISTGELFVRLCNEHFGDMSPKAYHRLHHALAVLATHGLSDCVTRDKPRVNSFKRVVRPWRWHRSNGQRPEEIVRVPASSLRVVEKALLARDTDTALTTLRLILNSCANKGVETTAGDAIATVRTTEDHD